MAKKHAEHEEHENHEAWVIPYADMLTLLMALFLVLWAMGNPDAKKAEAVRGGFAGSLGIGPAGASLSDVGKASAASGSAVSGGITKEGTAPQIVAEGKEKVDKAELINMQARSRANGIKGELDQLGEVQKKLQAQLDSKGLTDKVKLRLEPEGLIVVATDGLLFAAGSAELGDPGVSALDLIAEAMRSQSQPLRIEGHTDPTPIATALYPSNWELSSARAARVLRHLAERAGIPPDRLSAAGYADTKPAGPNDTPEGRAANRRVEIVLVAIKGLEPLPAGTDGIPGSVAGTVDISGEGSTSPGIEGSLGAPDNVAPPLPKPSPPTTPAAGH